MAGEVKDRAMWKWIVGRVIGRCNAKATRTKRRSAAGDGVTNGASGSKQPRDRFY